MTRQPPALAPVILTAFAALATLARPAQAVEALPAGELADRCEYAAEQPDSPDGIFCIRYMQGFIDGSVATGERVTLKIADEVDAAESFTDRATWTRLRRQLDRFGPSYYADFCHGEPVPLAEVTTRAAAGLADPERRSASQRARAVVHNTLRAACPCKATDSK